MQIDDVKRSATCILDTDDLALCHDLSRARWKPKRRAGVRNTRVDKTMSDQDVDFVGVKAEFACATYLGQAMNQRSGLQGTGVIDLRMPDRKTIQISGTVHSSGRFILRRSDMFKADYGILCYVAEEKVKILGYIAQKDWPEVRYREDLGYGQNWVVDQVDLRPISELKARYV